MSYAEILKFEYLKKDIRSKMFTDEKEYLTKFVLKSENIKVRFMLKGIISTVDPNVVPEGMFFVGYSDDEVSYEFLDDMKEYREALRMLAVEVGKTKVQKIMEVITYVYILEKTKNGVKTVSESTEQSFYSIDTVSTRSKCDYRVYRHNKPLYCIEIG